MCDSLVVNYDATKDGNTIFAKVSDRAVNEPQYFVYVPSKKHTQKQVEVTQIPINQVAHTNSMILSKPSWMWGAEIGVNEFGVCAGNESIYSKEIKREPALMGMDIVRIALECGRTAEEAVITATQVLEKYAQGGNCSFDSEFYYDNSILFADRKESWLLETAGDYWAAKRLAGATSISNYMTIGRPDLLHKDAISHAKEAGYKVTDPFDFTVAYNDWEHPGNRNGMIRKHSSQRALDDETGSITYRDVIKILQSHTTENPFYLGNFSVCKHATGKDGIHQATNACVIELKKDETVIWGTGMSIPCSSLFKPFWFDCYSSRLVFDYDKQTEALDDWLWREQINRGIISGRIHEQSYKSELAALQQKVFDVYEGLEKSDRKNFCEQVLVEEKAFLEFWIREAAITKEEWKDLEFNEFWSKSNSSLGANRTIFY